MAGAAMVACPAVAEDAGALKRAMADVAARDWSGAEIAARASGPLASDIVAWHRLRAGRGTLAEYRDFAARNADWPGMALLYERAERAMGPAAPAADVVAWFADRQPLTGNGLRQLIRATAATEGREAAKARLLPLWSTATPALTPEDEAALIADWGPALGAQGGARVRAALNRGEWQIARRSLGLVPEAERALATLRADLQAGLVPDLADRIATLPEAQRSDPGLALDRFRAAVAAKDGATAQAVMLAQSTSAAALVDPALWAQRRADYTRAALRAGDAATAQRLATAHYLPTTNALWTDLEWLAGYAAYKAGDLAAAKVHFDALAAGSPTAITQSRAAYWLARTAEKAGDTVTAQTMMRAAARHQSAFYGQLAAEAVGVPMDPALATAGTGIASLPDWRGAAVRRDDRVQVAIWLFVAGQPDLAQRFLLQVAETATPEDIGRLTRLMAEFGQTHHALRLAKSAAMKGVTYPAALFPLTGLEREPLGVPPELALAIARRESEFNPRAQSPSGARGLMQVMPATARDIARDVGLPYDLNALSTNPDYNALYGANYLAGLRERYGPSIALVAAGYNAGPGRSAQWLKSLGEIRGGADPVDWVEAIPFDETRNYVMRVAEALPIYRARIAGAPVAWSVTADLTGGGVRSVPIPRPVLTLTRSLPPQRNPRAAVTGAASIVAAEPDVAEVPITAPAFVAPSEPAAVAAPAIAAPPVTILRGGQPAVRDARTEPAIPPPPVN